MSSTCSPSWLTVGGRALATFVHRPDDGVVRGTVVLCDPLFRDRMLTERSLRLLATRLADAGLLAIRFTWSSTVESGGDVTAALPEDASGLRDMIAEPPDIGPEGIERWHEELRALIAHGRDLAGSPEVTVVAMRVTAMIAAAVAEEDPGLRLVLWQPTASGRTWLRSLGTLLKMSPHAVAMSGPPLEPGSADIPGTRIPPGTGRALSQLRLGAPTAGRCPDNTLVMTDEEVGLESTARDYAESECVTHLAIPGSAAMLNFESTLVDTPVRAVDAIVDWVTSSLPRAPRRMAEFTPITTAVVATGGVVEEFVDVAGMPGVLTRGVGTSRGALLTIPAAGETRDGQGGLWVRLARVLALQGLTSVRVDIRGVGEMATTDGASAPWPYRRHVVEDYTTALDWVTTRVGRTPILLGSCAGAWTACSVSGHRSSPMVLAPSLIASIMSPPDTPVPWFRRTHPSVLSAREESARSFGIKAKVAKALTRSPGPMASALSRVDLALFPEPFLRRAMRHGAQLRLRLGEQDRAIFDAVRGPTAVHRLVSQGLPVVLELDTRLDHALFTHDARLSLVEWVLTEIATVDG